MGSMFGNRAAWKTWLVALGLGVLVAAIAFGICVKISEDLRLLYIDSAVLLFLGATWIGIKRGGDWLSLALLYLPVAGAFSFFVLPELPFLLPQLLFWALAIAAGAWVIARSGRTAARIFGVAFLVAISAWYCVAYIPDQLKRAANHRGDAAAPEFTFQPVSDGAVPTKAAPGKILIIDFFGTWCPPCIAELPEIERVRSDLQNRRDVEFVMVGTSSSGDTPEKLRAFGRRHQVTLPIAFDPGGKAHSAFGLKGYPGLVVIDRTGRVRLTRQGYNSSETSFRSDLVQLLQSL